MDQATRRPADRVIRGAVAAVLPALRGIAGQRPGAVIATPMLTMVLVLSGCATQSPKAEPTASAEADTTAEEQADAEPEPSTVSVIFETEPPGGRIQLLDSGRELDAGEAIELEPGSHAVRATREGYRPGETTVRIDEGRHEPVVVDLGAGVATLVLERATPGADVRLTGPDQRRAIRFDAGDQRELTLEAGEYTVRANRPGYHAYSERIRLEPGDRVEKTIALRERPRTTPVTVRTVPAGAKIRLDDAVQGTGEADLGRLPFGEHRLAAVKRLDDRHRLTTSRRIELRSREPRTVTLELDRRERRFEGEWLAVAEAERREQQRYTRQRVDAPGAIELRLDRKGYESLISTDRLAQKLQSWLRVGDRVRVRHGDQVVLLWKRHGALAPNLETAVRALADGRSYRPDLPADPSAFEHAVEAGDAPLWRALHRLHRSRADQALLDLRRAQLPASSVELARSTADGPITLLARTHQGLTVGGESIASSGGIAFAQLEPGNGPVDLAWSQPPQRLLVMSDRSVAGLNTPEGGFLKLGEKKLVRLVEGAEVERLQRLSHGPAYDDGWHRKTLDRSGPMGDAIDLNRGEIGPHRQPGEYRRVWLVRIADADGVTQRQMAVAYTVRRQEAKFTTDNFLRRDENASGP